MRNRKRNIAIDLGDALADARRQSGVTWSDFAERTGISNTTIQGMFRGQYITAQRFLTVCDVLGLDPSKVAGVRVTKDQLAHEAIADVPMSTIVAVLEVAGPVAARR